MFYCSQKLKDILVSDSTLVSLNNCSKISFKNVLTKEGIKPVFQKKNAEDITF
jgi:hypothetical protein